MVASHIEERAGRQAVRVCNEIWPYERMSIRVKATIPCKRRPGKVLTLYLWVPSGSAAYSVTCDRPRVGVEIVDCAGRLCTFLNDRHRVEYWESMGDSPMRRLQ